jgi:hypothetical protein
MDDEMCSFIPGPLSRDVDQSEPQPTSAMDSNSSLAPVAPGPKTRRRMRAAEKRLASKTPPTEVRVTRTESGRPWAAPACADELGWSALAREALGTASEPFVETEISRLLQALDALRDGLPLEDKVNAALAVIRGVEPQNEVEATVAIQMALCHAAITALLGRVVGANPLLAQEHVAINGAVASKLMRAFAGHVQALTRMRRPAIQIVRVERVEVRDGGQAVIGTVSPSARGGRGKN